MEGTKRHTGFVNKTKQQHRRKHFKVGKQLTRGTLHQENLLVGSEGVFG